MCNSCFGKVLCISGVAEFFEEIGGGVGFVLG